MSNSDKYVQGRSKEKPKSKSISKSFTSKLKIVSPALDSNYGNYRTATSARGPENKLDLRLPPKPVLISKPIVQNQRYPVNHQFRVYQTSKSGANKFPQNPQNVIQPIYHTRNVAHQASVKSTPKEVNQVFNGSLQVINDNKYNGPPDHRANEPWNSRKIKIQDPALINTKERALVPNRFVQPQHLASYDNGDLPSAVLPPLLTTNQGGWQVDNRYFELQHSNLHQMNGTQPIFHPKYINSSNMYAQQPETQRSLPNYPQTLKPKPKQPLRFDYNKHSASTYFTYLSLCDRSYREDIVFRVHDSTSASPLIWTGNAKTSGFFATSNTFKHLTPKSYQVLFKNQFKNEEYIKDMGQSRDFFCLVGGENWLKGRLMHDIMIDHILARPRFDLKWEKMKQLEYSNFNVQSLDQYHEDINHSNDTGCWISTTKGLDWAIYEISKRLISKHDNDDRQGKDKSKNEFKVNLSIIDSRPSVNSIFREKKVNPYHRLQIKEPWNLTQNRIKMISQAQSKAKHSLEILYYGRIFSQNIKADWSFTVDYLPFKLPSRFWKPSHIHSDSHLPGWLGRLRWDPRKDDWQTALNHMKRKILPTTTWEAQPIHDWESSWPPSTAPSAIKGLRQRQVHKLSTEIGSTDDSSLLEVNSEEEDDHHEKEDKQITGRIGSYRPSGQSVKESAMYRKMNDIVDLHDLI
ncbi:uncharacterized protein L201_004066 [Kwoniella dendrophila CBS 6074]|uniref:Uncharacterized protein n=1 Tax=Kwoniella dendrophila CBS 6074 TaxID=1295534 RepID=A0AAX4JW57_9TREE